jgi:hypothetical protein
MIWMLSRRGGTSQRNAVSLKLSEHSVAAADLMEADANAKEDVCLAAIIM